MYKCATQGTINKEPMPGKKNKTRVETQVNYLSIKKKRIQIFYLKK